MDSVLLTRNAYSLADLSLCPAFRRKWSSIYEALQDTKVQRNKLMGLYIQQMSPTGRIVLAGDHTAWVLHQTHALLKKELMNIIPKVELGVAQ